MIEIGYVDNTKWVRSLYFGANSPVRGGVFGSNKITEGQASRSLDKKVIWRRVVDDVSTYWQNPSNWFFIPKLSMESAQLV